MLSLWDGSAFKTDLQDLLYIDEPARSDMIKVFHHLYMNNQQLESLVSEAEMKPILLVWGNVFKSPDDDCDYSVDLVQDS